MSLERGWRRHLLGGVVLLALLIPAAAHALPDTRGWEMVSPVDKNGGVPLTPGQVEPGALQATLNGTSVAWAASSAFGEGAQGAPPASQYVSTRGSGGWSTENISPAQLSGAYEGAPYLAFSTDPSRRLLLNPARCPEGDPCPAGYQLQESSSGAFAPSPADPGLFEGASGNLEQIVFRDDEDLYRWQPPASTLILLSNAPAAGLGQGDGAVSEDGSRIYWQGVDGNLYLREGASTTQVDDAQGGGGSFRAASADGSIAFFAKAAHLYRYDAATDVATDLTPAGGLLSVLGASADATRLFFLSASGLQRWSEGTGTTQLVANPLPGADPSSAGANDEGSRLFFTTTAALVASDTNKDRDVYQWEANGTGSCAKAQGCTELISSGRAEGGAVFVDASADGSSAFFVTDGSLVKGDPGAFDLYVARVGGGFPDPLVPIPCEGDSCQSLPPEPVDPGLATLFVGPGNPKVHYVQKKARRCRGKGKGQRQRRGCKKAKGKGNEKAKGGRR